MTTLSTISLILLVLFAASSAQAEEKEKSSAFSFFRRAAKDTPKVDKAASSSPVTQHKETHVLRRPDVVYALRPTAQQMRKRTVSRIDAGALVSLLRMGSDYSEVKLQDGKRGWVATTSLRAATEEDFPVIVVATVVEEKRVAASTSSSATAFAPPASFIEPDLPAEGSSPMSFELLMPGVTTSSE